MVVKTIFIMVIIKLRLWPIAATAAITIIIIIITVIKATITIFIRSDYYLDYYLRSSISN